MSQGLLNALLGGDASDDYNVGPTRSALGFGTKRMRNLMDNCLPSATTLIARHVTHALSPYDNPPAPMPYGGTGGAEQLIISSANVTFVQPAGYAGFLSFTPCYVSGGNTISYTDGSYALPVIQSDAPAGLQTTSLVGSSFNTAQLETPTNGVSSNSGGVKCKWNQCFIRVRCVDNVVNRGGDGFIGQVTQQGGCDVNGVGQQSFNTLIQQRLIKKLLVNGEWNDWHCTTFEEDLRYSDEQYDTPRCGVAKTPIGEGQASRAYTVEPYFCFLYPNVDSHTWEAEIYFTFQADGNTGLATDPSAYPPVQPNIQDIPHVPEAANINAALAYARSKIPAGNSKHTSIGHHVSNFFKSVGHDLEHGLNDALTGAAAAGAAALFM